MISYTLADILSLENEIITSNDDLTKLPYLTDSVIQYIYTLEYKFKDKRYLKSKYHSPKPITFDDIRLNLNKLSNKTYTTHFKYIVSTLHCLNSNENTPLFQSLISHISNNSFMVGPYSKLSASLIEIFPEYSNIFIESNDKLLRDVSNFVAPCTTSYNELCNTNKIKDSFRSNISFFAYNFLISKNYTLIQNNIINLQNALNDKISNIQLYKSEAEFISELIFKYIKITLKEIVNIKKWSSIYYNVKNVLNKKNNKEISRKIIFNHMDIDDLIHKLNAV